MRILVTAFPIGDKFVGLMLFPNKHEPVYYFRTAADPALVIADMYLMMRDVESVTQGRFNYELDHIKLFGMRAHEHAWGVAQAAGSDKVTINPDTDSFNFDNVIK